MKRKKIGNIELFVFLGLAFILNLFSIRICPFFNILKIPCPGCGLTRSVMCFIKGNFLESISYHILGIPIIFGIVFYIILYVLKKSDVIDLFLKKHKKIILPLSIILLIVVEIINIHNPKLY